ncbi:PorP/SprF family type IX secretion system membrane protein [Pontibacter roseus]|uniref:PorP/SprF family type IX secretion system membrane protein n=1 Tax=Pontibacter roseus TaxID=336989 RepID=UPI000368EF7E|nr:PorP/SprF family type IX secretion system membrane protein [Pontibacter roseus]
MNKLNFLPFLLLFVVAAQAQSIKHVSNFSAYQQFYNPALTGNEGSVAKSFYRNQWTGFEDAPKTIFFSAEMDAADFSKSVDKRKNFQFRDSGTGYQGAKHAFGLTALQDRFGPARETQLQLNYGTGVRLSEKLSLRWGGALTYHNYRVDGSSLVVDEESDPRYQDLYGQDARSSKADLNLGIALASGNYYLGYAMQDVTRGHFNFNGDTFSKELYTRKHVVQAGFRTDLTDQFGMIVNGLYQYDQQVKSTTEAQVKLVYQNMVWLGGGYRNELAYNLAAGVNFSQLRISYAYESPIQEARSIQKSTNEIGLSYTFRPATQTRTGSYSVSFW